VLSAPRVPIERIGLAIALGTVLIAIAATQYPFNYNLTLFGIERRWERIDWRWFPRTYKGAIRLDRDFALNLLMLLPLGVGYGLWRSAARLRVIAESLAVGIATSVVLEAAQLITPYRYTTVADVWRNGLGCMVGSILAVWLRSRIGVTPGRERP